MGFRVLERTIGKPTAPVRFTFAFPRGVEDARLHVCVVGWLLRQVCGAEGDTEYDCTEDAFEVQIGTDEDLGRIRIVRSPEGNFKATHAPRADCYLIRLGHVVEMPSDAHAKAEPIIEFAAGDGALEITFPAWIFEETRKITQEPMRQLPAPAPPPPPPPVVRSRTAIEVPPQRVPTRAEREAREARLKKPTRRETLDRIGRLK